MRFELTSYLDISSTATLKRKRGSGPEEDGADLDNVVHALLFSPMLEKIKSRQTKRPRFTLTTVSERVALSTRPAGQTLEPAKLNQVKSQRRRTTPVFTIREDTEDEATGIILAHSTQSLEISANESRVTARLDRGQENLPATEGTSTVRPRRRTINRARSPLRRL